MKHIKLFEADGIRYSGKDVTKMPILGTIKTKEIKWGRHTIASTTMDVVEVIENDGKRIYVIDKWYKPGIPQIVSDDMVETYEPK